MQNKLLLLLILLFILGGFTLLGGRIISVSDNVKMMEYKLKQQEEAEKGEIKNELKKQDEKSKSTIDKEIKSEQNNNKEELKANKALLTLSKKETFESALYYNYYYKNKLDNIQLEKDENFSYGMVTHPKNENLYYFSTNKLLNDNTVRIRIYSFNKDNNLLQTELEQIIKQGEFLSEYLNSDVLPQFHVLGFEIDVKGNERLTILAQEFDDSPHPCTDPLIFALDEYENGIRKMFALTLDTHEIIINHYLPKMIWENADSRTQTCLDNLKK